MEKKRAGGVASNFDVLRAQVELSNFEADLIRSKNAINIARANLIKTMGVSQDSDFVLADEFVYAPIKVADGGGRQDGLHEPARPVQPGVPDSPAAGAASDRAQPLSAERQRVLHLHVGQSQSGQLRQRATEWGRIWQTGVQGAWPIFDGFQREGTIMQQKARLRQAQIGLVDAEETAVFELTQAILSMENAEEFVQSQRLNLTRATEGLRLAEVGYEQGINTQVEVIDAQSALTTARVNYYQAIYQHVVAKLAVERAMGTIVKAQAAEGPTAGKAEDGKQSTEGAPSSPPAQDASKKE